MTGRTLILFLSNGRSLGHWREEGLLSRELLLYAEFLRQNVFERVLLFTYDPADQAILDDLAKADPVYGRMALLAPGSRAHRGLGAVLDGVVRVWRARNEIAQAAWLKTNQVSGSWTAVFAARLCRRPLMIRLGYLLSRRFAMNGQNLRWRLALLLERLAFRAATRVVVTSAEALKTVAADPAVARKASLVPTYVDVDTFRAKGRYDFEGPMIYVGRLEPQKNLINLVRACRQTGRGLDLIGVGSLEGEIAREAEGAHPPIRLLGRLPNEIVAERLQDHTVFILPSHYEGLPKVLIEAMATGLISIGSDVPGVVDLIEDGRTGYLIRGFETADIAAQIERAHAERNAALGSAARAKIEETFSLQRYLKAEAALFAQGAV